MKHLLFKVIVLLPFITLLAYGFQDQQKQDVVKEYVRIINVEVIVRVSDQGQAVRGLKKSDFRLTEDGQELKINGFNEFHRTMAPEPDTGAIEQAVATARLTPVPRLFILYFWLFEADIDYQQALDYFFKTVYRSNDRVLLVSSRQTYEISRPEEITPQRQALTADLTDFTQLVVKSRRGIRLGMKTDAERGFEDRDATTIAPGRQRPLDVDVKQFREFAASLKNIDMEKWVLVFCQRNLALFSDASFVRSTHSDTPRVPNLDNAYSGSETSGQGHDPSAFFGFIVSQTSGHRPLVNFNRAEMEKMFIQCGATFHLLVLAAKDNSLLSEQAHYEELKTGWQNVFATISSATGGSTLQDIDMTGALQKFSRQQDVYYILTYQPTDNPQLKRKINLELPGKYYDLFYDNESTQRHIGKFAINDIQWQEPFLKLKVENYLLDLQPQGLAGHIVLTIIATPEQGEELTITRELWLPQNKPEIQLKLRFPSKGSYRLFIEAVDLLGQDTASSEIKISWRDSVASPVQPEKKVEEIIDEKRDD